jgi:hypothetical protein
MSFLFALAIQGAIAKSRVDLNQSQLNIMSDACKAPRQWLVHLGGEAIRFRPSPNAKYKRIDCVLKRLRASMAPKKLGFIGNEQLSEDK